MNAAIFGYFLGTLQIVFIDWGRNRIAHARHLRLLRADLRNALTFDRKFGWEEDGPPEDEILPRPPSLSPNFLPTLSITDFRLTDENDDDNTTQSLLSIVDGMASMRQYHDDVLRLVDKIRLTGDITEKRELRGYAIQTAKEYDRLQDDMTFLLTDALKDMGRRLHIAGLIAQAKRIGHQLPSGGNPPPLKRNDPRVEAFHARRAK